MYVCMYVCVYVCIYVYVCMYVCIYVCMYVQWNRSYFLQVISFTHTYMQILLQLLAVMLTWQSQDACALSKHCEPCKQSSWTQARNSHENRPFLTASSVGTWSPTWTIAVSWEMALNLHLSKCQVPNHIRVDWWGWWEADGKPDGKIAWVGYELRTSGPEPRTQPLHHTCIHIQPFFYSSLSSWVVMDSLFPSVLL